jgi:hypothetical protein
MKAITIWQPWATLIAEGCKPYEFRCWPAPSYVVGERIAIHAGARKVKLEEVKDLLYRLMTDGGKGTALEPSAIDLLESVSTRPASLPLSSIVCTAVLGQPRKASALFGGDIADSDRIDQHVWAWPLTDIQRMEPPQPAKGAQGFWNWSE